MPDASVRRGDRGTDSLRARAVRALALCATLALAAGGCSPGGDRPDGGDDAELTALVDRARGIQAKLEADTAARPALGPEWERLVEDVKAWQARTGRSDIRTGVDSARGPTGGTAAADDDGGGGGGCDDCPGYTVEPDRICLLEVEGECPGPEDFFGRICVYRCIWIGAGTEPEMVERAEKN